MILQPIDKKASIHSVCCFHNTGIFVSGKLVSAVALCLILFGLPAQAGAQGVPPSVGRWKLVTGDGFCWMSAKASSGSTVQIVFTPNFMADQIWLLDGSRGNNIIPKTYTSAVIVDDIGMSADASGSFEPVRVLNISDNRLRHAVRVGRVMKLYIEGRTRAQLSLAGSSDALSALTPCFEGLNGQAIGLAAQSPSPTPRIIDSSFMKGNWGWGNGCAAAAFSLDSSGNFTDGVIRGNYSIDNNTIKFFNKSISEVLPKGEMDNLLDFYGVDRISDLLKDDSLEVQYISDNQLRPMPLTDNSDLLTRC